MKEWENWYKYIAEGGGGSWPRDAFESLLDYFNEKLKGGDGMLSNLPPGVTENDLPGNRPEDEEWDKFYEKVDNDTIEMKLYVDQATTIWEMGKAAWNTYKSTYTE